MHIATALPAKRIAQYGPKRFVTDEYRIAAFCLAI
jgi:hypothetical protein